MNIYKLIYSFLLLSAISVYAQKTHVEVIDQSNYSYTVKMQGAFDGESTRDPVGYWAYDQYWEPNKYVRIENVGNTLVRNPWLRRTDRPDTRTLQSIVDYVVKPGMTDGEKARALFEFEIKQRFHATTGQPMGDNDREPYEVNDVIKRFNCYGYTLCQNESVIMSDLWRTAGLKTRSGWPNGHSTAEVWYDGMWHLMDSDESIICLMPDNETVAGEEEIVADHDLMKRVHSYGPLHDRDRFRDESSSSLHFYEGVRTGEDTSETYHTMDFDLRPGESLTWAWDAGNRYHSAYDTEWNKHWRLIANVMDGSLEYNPDLTDKSNEQYINYYNMKYRASGPFGCGYYSTADTAAMFVNMKSAWPMVGGRFIVDFNRRDMGDDLKVYISFDDGKTYQEMASTFSSDYARMYIDLNQFFPLETSARYECLYKLELTSGADEPLACIRGFDINMTIQMARLAMPGVSLGVNKFIYSDDSNGKSKVMISHSWEENSDRGLVPGKVPAAVFPGDGASVKGTLLKFEWRAPSQGANARDYQFQLSEFKDIRWPLSSNFDVLTNRSAWRGTTSYELPYVGLLNPGQEYYWRVRARGDKGVWGPWSSTFSFRAQAPAVPVNLSKSINMPAFDMPKNWIVIWNPGEGGTEIDHYKIYGSDERGFTASDTSYVMYAGLETANRRMNRPANLLHETAGTDTSWVVPDHLIRPFYRVVAVDRDGYCSGPSAMLEIPHPVGDFIRKPIWTKTKAAEFFEVKPDFHPSIGHLVSANENGKAYQVRLRTGDNLRYEMEGAPKGLTIDSAAGIVSGYISRESTGKYEIKVKAYRIDGDNPEKAVASRMILLTVED